MTKLEHLIKECETLEKENRQEAERYYQERIFPRVKEIVKERAVEDKIGNYKGLILTTGFSPEPLIITITALAPEKVFFLYTKDSERYLNRIVEESSLLPAQIDRAVIGRSDGLDVYEKVKDKWAEWSFDRIAIDITGGTKAMVGGLVAVAGVYLKNVDLLYMEAKFGWILSKPYPGRERIVRLSNPFDVFGDLEKNEGTELFKSFNHTDRMESKKPMIFLAHAKEDKEQVYNLYLKLKEAEFEPWLDEKELLAGQVWRDEIQKAIKKSDFIIACLSKISVAKKGYVQKEYRTALDLYEERPPGDISLIPVRLDDCTVPDLNVRTTNLRDIQWVDFFKPDGFENILESIMFQWLKNKKEPINHSGS